MNNITAQRFSRISLLLVLCFIGLALASATVLIPLSSGAPASATGAPGEDNCTKAGCHDDASLNKGIALSMLDLAVMEGSYSIGESYPVVVSISDSLRHRFGYQLVALDQFNRNAGSFRVVDESRTQVVMNLNEMTDRQYATYTNEGTNETQRGEAKWNLNWIAPATNVGPVTFYLATVAANNDGTDKGDDVYLQKKVIPSRLASEIHPSVPTATIEVSPLPVMDVMHIKCANPAEQIRRIKIVDLRGSNLLDVSVDNQMDTHVDCSKLLCGHYTVVIETSHSTEHRTFIKR